MKKWTIQAVFLTMAVYAVIILVTQFLVPQIARLAQLETMTAFALVVMLSAFSSIPVTYVLKTKGKKIWMAELILMLCVLLLFLT